MAALPGEDWRATVTEGLVELATTATSRAPQAEVAQRVAQSVHGVVRVLLDDRVPGG